MLFQSSQYVELEKEINKINDLTLKDNILTKLDVFMDYLINNFKRE